jgi:legumain
MCVLVLAALSAIWCKGCGGPQAMVAAWEQSCGTLDQYGMQHSRTFANLCNAGVPIQTFARTVAAECMPVMHAS